MLPVENITTACGSWDHIIIIHLGLFQNSLEAIFENVKMRAYGVRVKDMKRCVKNITKYYYR
jgi:hypothetical protein